MTSGSRRGRPRKTSASVAAITSSTAISRSFTEWLIEPVRSETITGSPVTR